MRLVPLVAVISLLPTAALAASFSAPLPDLVGTVDFPTSEAKEAAFDFGQQFSEIESVSIEIGAHVFAREFDYCGTGSNPQPCVHEVQLLGFFASMDTEDSPSHGLVFTEELSFSDDFNALEGSGTDVEPFRNSQVGWDFLLDGEGSLRFAWNGTFWLPGVIIENLTEPSGEIFSARLILEGTAVPEPSTALLIAAGLAVLARGRRETL